MEWVLIYLMTSVTSGVTAQVQALAEEALPDANVASLKSMRAGLRSVIYFLYLPYPFTGGVVANIKVGF